MKRIDIMLLVLLVACVAYALMTWASRGAPVNPF